MNITGKIESFDGSKTTKKGAPYWVIGIQGKTYSVFDKTQGDDLKLAYELGQVVMIDLEKKGEYENIVKVQVAHAEAKVVPTTSQATSPPNPIWTEFEKKDANIRRQVALKCAVRAIDLADKEITSDGILALAEKFEKWLSR